MKLKDYRTNTLSHVESHLVFNIPSWEGGSLVPGRDTNLYTCSSSSNSEGPGVNSTTLFRSADTIIVSQFLYYLNLHSRVHFPPRNIKISPSIQTVKETLKPRDFLCSAEVVKGFSKIK